MAEDKLQVPEWLVDDTAEISDARVFVVHTAVPAFVGELIPEDEESDSDILGALTFAGLPDHQSLVRIRFFGRLATRKEAEQLFASLSRAIRHHDAVRSGE